MVIFVFRNNGNSNSFLHPKSTGLPIFDLEDPIFDTAGFSVNFPAAKGIATVVEAVSMRFPLAHILYALISNGRIVFRSRSAANNFCFKSLVTLYCSKMMLNLGGN